MAEDMDTTADQHVNVAGQAESEVAKNGTDAPVTTEATGSSAEGVKEKNEDTTKENAPAEPTDENEIAKAEEQPAETTVETQDTEMKDGSSQEQVTAPVTNGAPATPASTKKSGSSGSSKKKSSGVPEHKTKKLNRKKSKMELHLDAQPGELYLARMKGHPAWPSVICDEAMLPIQLLNTRPVTTALPDGTFKKPEYADGGKRAHERTFPIMFLFTNEFAWMPNTELTPTTPEECRDVPEKGKTKALLEAYRVASEEHDLEHFKKMLADHQEAMNEDAERRAEREAKKAEKAERARRKSEAAADDEMDVDEEVDEPKPKSKKRKKSMDADEADEKPAKTPKTTKLKLNAPKTPTSESSKKKTPAKPKSSSKKQAAKNGSDDEMADTPVVEEQKQLTPAEAKEKKEKEIRYYRHKLQKGFLSRDDTPNDEEITSMSTYLNKLESYPDLEGAIIRATKIHKVLKAMIRLNSIPKDEEFNFKKRSMDLLVKWNKILAEDPSGAADKDDEKDRAEDKAAEEDNKPEAKVETNGIAKEAEPKAAGALQDEDKEAAASKETGNGVEGEKEAEKPAEAAGGDKTDAPQPADDAPVADHKPTVETAEAVEATA